MRLLLVVAVDAERDALVAGLGDIDIDILTGGVGVAAAAAATSLALVTARSLGRAYSGVVSMGIGGGFSGRAAIGEIALCTRSVAADLGADSADGFVPVEELGFGRSAFEADPALHAALAGVLPTARAGSVLTVSTVTGTRERTADLTSRHPDAVAEAMEGYGVATAANLIGTAFAEVRTISNEVGPRDRDAWRIGAALAALRQVGTAVGRLVA